MTQHPQRPDPDVHFARHAAYNITHTLCGLLPAPAGDTQPERLSREQAAIAKVRSLRPVNPDEMELAVDCVLARAQAQSALRELQACGGGSDKIELLRRQFALMQRTAIALRSQLQKLQAARQKREADSAAATSDSWLSYTVGEDMQVALRQTVPPDMMEIELPAMPADPPSEPEQHPAEAALPPVAEPLPHPPAEPSPAVTSPALMTAVATPSPAAASPATPSPAAASIAAHTPASARTRTRVPLFRLVQDPDDPPRDLAAELARYTAIYPDRVQAIRQHGDLPPNCTFGPPDEDLLLAIIAGTAPALSTLGTPENATV